MLTTEQIRQNLNMLSSYNGHHYLCVRNGCLSPDVGFGTSFRRVVHGDNRYRLVSHISLVFSAMFVRLSIYTDRNLLYSSYASAVQHGLGLIDIFYKTDMQISRNIIILQDQWAKLLEMSQSSPLVYKPFLSLLHPDNPLTYVLHSIQTIATINSCTRGLSVSYPVHNVPHIRQINTRFSTKRKATSSSLVHAIHHTIFLLSVTRVDGTVISEIDQLERSFISGLRIMYTLVPDEISLDTIQTIEKSWLNVIQRLGLNIEESTYQLNSPSVSSNRTLSMDYGSFQVTGSLDSLKNSLLLR